MGKLNLIEDNNVIISFLALLSVTNILLLSLTLSFKGCKASSVLPFCESLLHTFKKRRRVRIIYLHPCSESKWALCALALGLVFHTYILHLYSHLQVLTTFILLGGALPQFSQGQGH